MLKRLQFYFRKHLLCIKWEICVQKPTKITRVLFIHINHLLTFVLAKVKDLLALLIIDYLACKVYSLAVGAKV